MRLYYISHIWHEMDLIDPYIAWISQLSILYIQDQDNSTYYIKYNVNSNPTITNSYITVSVTFLDAGGTGLTNFGSGMHIFLSIFTNDIEINTRLSNLETKTQNVAGTASELTLIVVLNWR